MAAVGVSLPICLQKTKSANISKTIRDRAISSEFLTHRDSTGVIANISQITQ